MSRRIWTRQLSPRTEKTYLAWIRRYLTFHGGRDPEGFGTLEAEAFAEHLGIELNLVASSQNQALSAVMAIARLRWPGTRASPSPWALSRGFR